MAKPRYWSESLSRCLDGVCMPSHEAGIWMFVPVDDDWLASYRVIDQDGELVVAEVRLEPAPQSYTDMDQLLHDHARHDHGRGVPAGGLSTRLARSAIRVGEGLAFAREDGLIEAEGSREMKLDPLFSDQALARAPGRVGRRGRPDRFYAELAAAYVAAVEGGSRRPVEAVAGQLGDGYTAAYVRDALHRARQRELLTRPPRGRAGGRLTDKARAALADTGKTA